MLGERVRERGREVSDLGKLFSQQMRPKNVIKKFFFLSVFIVPFPLGFLIILSLVYSPRFLYYLLYIYFLGISSERCYISYLFNFFAYFLLCVLFLNYLQNREANRAARWRCAGKAGTRRLFDELDKLKWLNEEATQFVVFPPFCRVCEWLMSALKSHSLWCEQNTEGGIIIRRKCSRPLDKRT